MKAQVDLLFRRQCVRFARALKLDCPAAGRGKELRAKLGQACSPSHIHIPPLNLHPSISTVQPPSALHPHSQPYTLLHAPTTIVYASPSTRHHLSCSHTLTLFHLLPSTLHPSSPSTIHHPRPHLSPSALLPPRSHPLPCTLLVSRAVRVASQHFRPLLASYATPDDSHVYAPPSLPSSAASFTPLILPSSLPPSLTHLLPLHHLTPFIHPFIPSHPSILPLPPSLSPSFNPLSLPPSRSPSLTHSPLAFPVSTPSLISLTSSTSLTSLPLTGDAHRAVPRLCADDETGVQRADGAEEAVGCWRAGGSAALSLHEKRRARTAASVDYQGLFPTGGLSPYPALSLAHTSTLFDTHVASL